MAGPSSAVDRDHVGDQGERPTPMRRSVEDPHGLGGVGGLSVAGRACRGSPGFGFHPLSLSLSLSLSLLLLLLLSLSSKK
ncbi:MULTISPECIES: hypothetical protein [Parafrankia]|uniref:hypothetical protein n=1 Tax=Parafrankia TaxID=2994362 RepID=UPI000A926EB8|nr:MULTISPECIES: hypothetical protein [Parafrankia]MBE3205588.1 hypothetical protein [Parafrankia sp. CH37]